MNMKQTFGAAVIAVTLSLAPSGQEAQEQAADMSPKPHQLAGTWAGVTKLGDGVEIDVKPDGGGSWCYRLSNGALLSGPFNHATVKDNEIAWVRKGTKTVLRPSTKAKRALYYEDNRTTGHFFRMTLRTARKTRCVNRFRLEGDEVADVEKTANTPTIVGVWSGTWNASENQVGVLVESIGKRGRVRGRYCNRALDDEYGAIALFDMDGGSPIITSATRDRDRITMDHPGDRRHKHSRILGRRRRRDENAAHDARGRAGQGTPQRRMACAWTAPRRLPAENDTVRGPKTAAKRKRRQMTSAPPR